jgi:hypothetical protein
MTTLQLYPLYHSLCNEVAFYTTRLLISGIDEMIASEFYYPDGTRPMDYEYLVCGHCHNSTMDGFYSMPFSYKDDQPVEVTFDQVKT